MVYTELAIPLLLIRDPIVIWLTCVGLQRRWIKILYVQIMLVMSTFSLILSLLIAHQDLMVGLLG